MTIPRSKLGKIGTGSMFSKDRLKSELRKQLGSSTHVSEHDLKEMTKVVGGRLSKLPAGTRKLSSYAKQKMMAQAERLKKQGVISDADKSSLKKFTTSLGTGEQGGTKRLNTAKNSPWGVTGKPQKTELDPKQQARMKAYIKMDIADELAAEERGETVVRYRPGSSLARYDAAQRNRAEKRPTTFHDLHPHNSFDESSEEEDEKNKDKKGSVDLPNPRPVIDLDIG